MVKTLEAGYKITKITADQLTKKPVMFHSFTELQCLSILAILSVTRPTLLYDKKSTKLKS